MSKKNPISHVEWRSKDAARLQKFYAAVFKWKFTDSGMPGYTMVDFGNKGTAGGIMQLTPEVPMPPGQTIYANVEDLAEHEAVITANGGKVLISNQEIPGVGFFSMCVDPDGSSFALWKQAPPPKQAKKAAKKAEKAQKKAKKAEKAEKAEKKDKKGDKSEKKDKKK